MFTRKGIRNTLLTSAFLWISAQALHFEALSEDAGDSVIYGTYITLSMGNPGEDHPRDFYVSLGSKSGAKVGAKVEVMRRIATHDLMNRKLQKDMLFPIATLKIIHVEQNASIARLEKMMPEEATPAMTPRAVMVGDSVRLASK